MECVELKHSVAFAKYGTLSQAAKALHLSQPVLTRSMQHLEESLGVPLFNRTMNQIRLNETGKLAVELAKQVLKETKKCRISSWPLIAASTVFPSVPVPQRQIFK